MRHPDRPTALARALTRRELLVAGGRLGVAGALAAAGLASGAAVLPSAVRAQGGGATIGFLATRPAGDRGAMDDMLAALERARTDLGVATTVVTAVAPAGQEASIRRLAQAGADIVAVTFEAVDTALGTVAAEFPGTRFIGIGGGASAAPLANVVSVSFDTYLGAYLVGVLCGHATVTRQLGYLGGISAPDTNAAANALAQAAAEVDPSIVVTPEFAGSFADAGAGRLVADRLYTAGVDLLMTDAGASDLGAIDAALAAGSYLVAGSESVVELAPASVVATLAVLYGEALYEQLRSALDGAWVGGHQRSGIADGMIDLIVSDRFLAEGPADMTERIRNAAGPMDDARQAIIAGSLVPASVPLPPA